MEDALITELIPSLQKKFKVSTETKELFLTGHSSGAWSAVWILLMNPFKFAGAWVTAPDPLDFRDFYGVDLTVGSKENMFRKSDGKDRIFYTTKREKMESADGGDFSVIENEVKADEMRYASRPADGSGSEHIYNRETGELIQDTLKDWQSYDISLLVKKDFQKYLPALKNLTIVTGESDNFFLDRPTKLFCNKISALGLNDVCQFVPGRSHFDLYYPNVTYPEGLDVKFYLEMKNKVYQKP
jgi:hypothetical protein